MTDGLIRETAVILGEELCFFRIASFEPVDDIPMARPGAHVSYMFWVKEDFTDSLYRENDGYLDDTNDYVRWDGPTIPVRYSDGEIDEDAYVKYGCIVGKDNPDYAEIIKSWKEFEEPE